MKGPKPRSKARQGKRKSYTFTGCWTCRSRKVKCDERQTSGCWVCERAGLQCAGYDMNLCWVTGKRSSELQGLRRRQIKPIQPFAPGIPDDEINRMLVALDEIEAPSKTVIMGPFAVFHSDEDCNGEEHMDRSGYSCEFADDVQCTSRESESLEAQAADQQGPQRDYVDINGCFESQWQDQSIMPSEVDYSSTCVIPSPQLPQPALFDSNDDILLPSQAAEIVSICHPDQTIEPSHISSPHLELSCPLFQDPETSMLMYHYMNHVSELLQPVLHPRNPWRTTYFPFALEGCPDLFLVQSATPSSGASIALFHSVLSSAAFHLRNVKRGSKEFHRLGLQHRARALHALNTALVHPSNIQIYTVYLTAMLSLVTIDTMTGEDSDFQIHLRGCRQLKQPVSDSSRAVDDSSRQVTSICHFLTLLARTTSTGLESRPCSVDKPSFETPYFNSDDRGMEYIYGITPTLGNLLQRTCQLAECLSLYQGREAPGFVLQARESLKDELRRWSIESEQFYLLGPDEAMREIARCQARAFHSAVLIFFFRTVEPDSLMELELQTEVCSVWENLTTAEDLKDLYMGGEKRAAPMSWPAFIAACEASDRAPWTEWWTRVQDYWVGNFRKQWMVIQEIWDIMDRDASVRSWRDALKQSGRLVLPI